MNIKTEHSYKEHPSIEKFCLNCISWSHTLHTCTVSINCINQVLRGKEPSRFVDKKYAKPISDIKLKVEDPIIKIGNPAFMDDKYYSRASTNKSSYHVKRPNVKPHLKGA